MFDRTTICAVVLAVSLLLVGVVSGTVIRHVIQIIPIVILLLAPLAWRGAAAMPVCFFWLFIMVLIWLFLLGMSRIANGHYTPIEVALTVVMAGASIAGIIASGKTMKKGSWTTHAAVLAFF